MHLTTTRIAAGFLSALAVATATTTPAPAPLARVAVELSAYDQEVLADQPAAYLVRGADLTGQHTVTRHGPQSTARMPNGDSAPRFTNGVWWEVADAPDLSPTHTGRFTIEVWLRPDTLDFAYGEGNTGYVYWLGKGQPHAHEYAGRMYSTATPTEDPPRPNRVSVYGWTPDGGLGTGAYFQEPVAKGAWMHVVAIFDLTPRDAFPMGSVEIWRDGERKFRRGLDQHDTVMQDGPAPLRIGTRNLGSFYEGAVGKPTIYTHVLDEQRIRAHHQVMLGASG